MDSLPSIIGVVIVVFVLRVALRSLFNKSSDGSPAPADAKELTDEERIEEIGIRERAIRDHIVTHVGTPQDDVFADIVPGVVRVAVNFVPPSAERPYWFLFTTGMSSRPMPVHDGQPALAELVMALPPDWIITGDAASQEENYWPIRWLRKLARLPHEMNVAVGPGITIPNGDPAEAFAGDTEFCCMLLAPPRLPTGDFEVLTLPDGRALRFIALVPLLPSEVDAKLSLGPDEFMPRVEATGLTELLTPTRPAME